MADIKVVSEKWLDAQGIRDMVWSGAKDRVEDLTDDQIDTILNILSDEYPDGIDETELNDFFWFEDDTYAEWLGYNSAEDLWEGRDAEYYEIDKQIRINRADIPNLDNETSIESYLDQNFEYDKDFGDVDDSEEWDDEGEEFSESGSAVVDVSQSGMDKLNDAGIFFTEI